MSDIIHDLNQESKLSLLKDFQRSNQAKAFFRLIPS